MAVPDERKIALSISTQTGMKGLRELMKISACRNATRRDTFEIEFAKF
jgi:hypothetical protein